LCNGADAGKCNEYCKGKFGGELLGAECSAERPNKKRECICRLKCCNQGCWGDPHCWTCDGVKFGYQGMKKHYMLKPITTFPNIPYFTIAQINKVWQKGPMAILDISEVIIKDWKVTVEVKTPDGPTAGFIVKVNDEQLKDLPYRWSKIDEHRERFVNIIWGNAAKSQVVLTTSFGLKVVYTTNGAGNDRYTDLSIDTPRHPELKDHIHGLLGRWNDKPDDDSVDANGVKQPLDEGFSWAFGDSWIVPGGRTKTPDCVRDDAVKNKDDHINKVDPKIKENAEKWCKEALENPELTACAKKLHRAVPLHKNCVIDLIFLDSDAARKKYLKEIHNSFLDTCKRREKEQKAKEEAQKEKDKEAVGLAF
jgi:hypothetical protein